MKNAHRKIIAAIACSLVVGTIGTSYVLNLNQYKKVKLSYDNNNENTISNIVKEDEVKEEIQEEITDIKIKDKNEQLEVSEESSKEINNQQSINTIEIESNTQDNTNNSNIDVNTEEVPSSNVVEEVRGQYKDGTYVGTALGYANDVKLQVNVQNGFISNITILSHKETPGISDKAFEQIPSKIISSQSVNVDTVSGATYTSKAIINAVNQVLVVEK